MSQGAGLRRFLVVHAGSRLIQQHLRLCTKTLSISNGCFCPPGRMPAKA